VGTYTVWTWRRALRSGQLPRDRQPHNREQATWSLGVPRWGGCRRLDSVRRVDPNGNVVKANVIKGNDPDIFWDGSGTGNVFANNLCNTPVPSGLC